MLSATSLQAQSPAPAGTPAGYRLLPDSRLEVKTGKSGLLGFVGHDHLIRANAFDGEVRYLADSAEAITITIRIVTDGLEVLTPPDTAETRKVTAAMRTEVLHVADYPEMIFTSKAIAAKDGTYRFTADFTMHGATREITVPVTVEFLGDTLVARSRFDLRQTDFGIKPFRGGPAGAIRVADKVSFRIEARALPE
jgi:polyisoprenoid-binding protein YceI